MQQQCKLGVQCNFLGSLLQQCNLWVQLQCNLRYNSAIFFGYYSSVFNLWVQKQCNLGVQQCNFLRILQQCNLWVTEIPDRREIGQQTPLTKMTHSQSLGQIYFFWVCFSPIFLSLSFLHTIVQISFSISHCLCFFAIFLFIILRSGGCSKSFSISHNNAAGTIHHISSDEGQ